MLGCPGDIPGSHVFCQDEFAASKLWQEGYALSAEAVSQGRGQEVILYPEPADGKPQAEQTTAIPW